MEKEKKTVVLRDVVFLDQNLWKQIKMEEFDRDKRSTDPLNITSYPICILGSDGKLEEIDFISYKRQNNLCFDITSASLEIKRQIAERYGVSIAEISVEPEEKKRTVTLLHSTAPCLSDSSLNKEEKKQLGSEYVLVENRENGYKISKCILFNGYGEEIADKVYLSINLPGLSAELQDKIMDSVEMFIPNEYGYYDYVPQNEDTKEVDKTI